MVRRCSAALARANRTRKGVSHHSSTRRGVRKIVDGGGLASFRDLRWGEEPGVWHAVPLRSVCASFELRLIIIANSKEVVLGCREQPDQG